MSREVRKDVYDLDPNRIETEGFYVREDDESEEDFSGFKEAIRTRTQIDVPISVRTVGPATAKRYILVWGRRRLRAAIELGLTTIPVRDYGDLGETDAIKLQLSENLNRRDMTPAECATSFWELSQRGISNREIVALYSRAESYVSYMVRTGEAVGQLKESERRTMNRNGLLYVRDCQTIAALSTVTERMEALRTLIADRSTQLTAGLDLNDDQDSRSESREGKGRTVSPRRRPDEQQAFLGRGLRDRGRSFRIRWMEEDLRESPNRFVAELTAFLDTELAQLLARLDTLRDEYTRAGVKDQRLADVERACADVLARMKVQTAE